MIHRTASGLPDLIGPRGDLAVSECRDAMFRHRSLVVGVLRVLQRLSGMLPSREVILLPALLLRRAMGVRGDIVRLRRPLVIFVMRSVVITRGHR